MFEGIFYPKVWIFNLIKSSSDKLFIFYWIKVKYKYLDFYKKERRKKVFFSKFHITFQYNWSFRITSSSVNQKQETNGKNTFSFVEVNYLFQMVTQEVQRKYFFELGVLLVKEHLFWDNLYSHFLFKQQKI